MNVPAELIKNFVHQNRFLSNVVVWKNHPQVSRSRKNNNVYRQPVNMCVRYLVEISTILIRRKEKKYVLLAGYVI